MMEDQPSEIDPTVKNNRGGARAGAGRKAVPPAVRALREAVALLDTAAKALAAPGEPGLTMAAECAAAMAGVLRSRLLSRPRQLALPSLDHPDPQGGGGGEDGLWRR